MKDNSRQLVKTGLLDANYHRWLLNAFDQRIAGDYNVQITFSSKEVEEITAQARQFLQKAQNFLGAKS